MDILEHTIVIVGAGPTGLALGAELARLGIPSLILDKLPAGANTSRALAIHARTLEVLEPLEVTQTLLQEGLPISRLCVRDRNQLLASISFQKLHTSYPFVLICPQDRTEAILLQRLQALGGTVQRPCEVVAIHPNKNGAQLDIKMGSEYKTIQTQWLVGCDGMHSIVRKQVSIPFVGAEYEDSFVLADLEMDWPLEREELNIFFSKQGLLAVIPLPAKCSFRIIATMKNPPGNLSIDDLQQILEARGPMKKVTIHHMTWASRFHIYHHIAGCLWKDRILLAGDAAHVHSPAGGQGMNIGIQDAISLARAMKKTLQSGKDEALYQWQQERLAIAQSVVRLTDRLTKLGTLSSPSLQLLRNLLIRMIGQIPYVQNAIAMKLSELDNP